MYIYSLKSDRFWSLHPLLMHITGSPRSVPDMGVQSRKWSKVDWIWSMRVRLFSFFCVWDHKENTHRHWKPCLKCPLNVYLSVSSPWHWVRLPKWLQVGKQKQWMPLAVGDSHSDSDFKYLWVTHSTRAAAIMLCFSTLCFCFYSLFLFLFRSRWLIRA